MRTRSRARRWLTVAVASLALLPFAGCSKDPFTPEKVDLDCPSTAGVPVTIAAGARANSPAPTLPKPITDLVKEAAKSGAKIQLLRVDGAPSVAFSGMFKSTTENDVARAHELDVFLTRTLDGLKELTSKTPEADVLLALNEAARLTEEGGTIVLVDSGLQTTGQIRFQDDGTFGAVPAEVVAYLEKKGQLPKLKGRSVVLVGLGNTAEPQPTLTDPDLRTRVTALWRTIVEKSGADCVQVLETAATRPSVKTDVPVTVVPLPKAPSFVPCGTTVLRDDSIGFVADEATFRDPGAAQRTLGDLAALAKERGKRVELIGTTSSAGSSEPDRVALSLKRAEAVKAVLVQLGVPGDRITTKGAGSHGPNHVNDRGPDGSLVPAQAALNRSVVVLISCPT